MPKDYYDILELSRNAEPEAVKKAYRRLAKRYHPDVNKTTEAADRFKEVQEAYDVLSDTKKRKLYDQFGHAGVNAGDAQTAGAYGGFNPFSGQRQTNAGPGGFSFRFNDGGTDADMGNIFDQMFGRSSGGSFRSQRRPQPKPGEDIRHTIHVAFDTAVHGGKVAMKLSGPAGNETIDVSIPKAVANGAKLRVRGKGQLSPNGGEPGDLILTVRIGEHPYFTRDGLNLEIDVPVSIDEAVFGTTVEVPTLAGHAKLKIPPGTSGGQRLRLRGAGLENTKQDKGDLLACVRIAVPTDLTDEQRNLLAQLHGKLPDARRDVNWPR